MSISTEITRITEAKADIVSALAEKGVTVSDDASISDMGDYIRSIEVGGEMDFNTIYPVGSIYMSVNSTSPATLFGGTWEQIKDTFLLSAGDTYSAGATGGEASHTLTVSEMPSHNHNITIRAGAGAANYYSAPPSASQGGEAVTRTNVIQETGGGTAHNNMPPYMAVYMWKRTA